MHPHRPFVLNRAIVMPAGTAQVVLEVHDGAGKLVGDLGKIVLDSK